MTARHAPLPVAFCPGPGGRCCSASARALAARETPVMIIPLVVECYSGHRGEETPRAIRLGDRRIEVADVVDRWLAPEHRYFKVTSAEGDTWIIRHDITQDCWELTMFQSGQA